MCVHRGEEPPLNPIVNVFFAHCNLQCIYCQNWQISGREGSGERHTAASLADRIASQFAQLPDRLQMRGIPTLLLGWNFSYPKDDRIVRWKTDSGLMETSTYYVTMDRVAERNAPYYAAPGCLFGSRVIVP